MINQKLLKSHFLLFVLIAVYLIISILTYKDFGITADEEANYALGRSLFEYYLRKDPGIVFDRHPLSDPYFRIYPAIVDFLNFRRTYDFYHLLNLFFGTFMIVVPYIFVYSIYKNPLKSFFAALAVITTPRIFGHIPANPKDVPFAILYLFCLYLIYRFPEKPRLKNFLFTGIIFGLVQMVRTIGFGIPVTFFFFLLFVQKVKPTKAIKQTAIVVLISFLIMFAVWPFLHQNPLASLKEVFFTAKSYYHWDSPILFGGKFITKHERPWTYLFTWLGITTPIWVLFFSAFSFLPKKVKDTPSWKAQILLKFVIVFNIFLYLFMNPTIYNALRHFLYLLPVLSILACMEIFEIKLPIFRKLGYVWAVTGIFISIFFMVRLHPYEYSYFNAFAGYGKNALGKFEMEYWGASYKEAGEWLAQNLGNSELVPKVYTCNVASTVQNYADGKYEITFDSAEANYVLCDYEYSLRNDFDGELLYTVERLGMPFNYVIRVD